MNCKSMNNKRRSLALIAVFLSGLHSAIGCRGGRILKSGVTAEEKRLIIEEHNYLRQTVATGHVAGQPSAQNMQEMRWDDELAAKAQQWANECTFKHDPSRYISRFIMGQNLGILWSTIPLAEDDGDFPMRIRNWFNEVQKYAWGAKWSVVTGHYSQLVWGDTNLVGCGFSYYQTSRLYNKLYVCNYGPGGNVVGVKPYATGQPKCENFGMSASARYPGLCKPFEYLFAPNSINTQQSPSTYYTYKSFNSEYNKRKVGTSSITRNNVQSNLASPSFKTNANNEAYSASRRQETKTTTQQQYSNQRIPQPKSQIQQQSNRYQATSFQQSILNYQRQYQQRRVVTNKTHESASSQSNHWDQSVKNHL